MARCGDCGKFVGLENEDPEIDTSISGTSIEGTVTINLNCAECGTQLLTAECEVSIDLEDHFSDIKHDDEFEVTSESADPTDWHDGKPTTPIRYRRHFWGAEIELVVERTRSEHCLKENPDEVEKDDVTISEQVGEQASSFEEC